MKIIKEIDKDILTLGACLIPTMGALHAGHIQLIKEGKKLKLPLIVSIFVNPIQFNDKDDFANYPKTIDKDIEILNNLQVDYLFIPDSEYIYPSNGFESIDSGELGRKYEGESRPGHFDGVLTVVNRLFELIEPKAVIFGKKDAQQLFLIKKLVLDKKYKIQIIECKTVRDSNGLALSSRNILLSKKGENIATSIKKLLNGTKKNFLTSKDIENSLIEARDKLSTKNLKIDYLEILDYETFCKPTKISNSYIIVIAAYVEGIRLIDNLDFQLEETL